MTSAMAWVSADNGALGRKTTAELAAMSDTH